MKEIFDLQIDEYLILPVESESYYDKVRFTKEEMGYSWVAYDTWRACFPERNNYVLFFKTLAGAKRNFIKNGFKKMIQDTMIKGELI